MLAREAALPEVVAAFIPEHHGTMEITYFLDRAKKSGDGRSPNPSDFEYPGPKPRSKERSEEHTSELQSLAYLVCRLLLEKKKKTKYNRLYILSRISQA